MAIFKYNSEKLQPLRRLSAETGLKESQIEFTVWRKIPGVHMYWQPGYFWVGIRISLHGIRQTRRENPSKVRLLAEYFGLVEPAYDD